MTEAVDTQIVAQDRRPVNLNGEYRFKVDAKGRMSLPAKFRKVLSDELVVVRELEDQCIYVFEVEDYEAWIDRLFEQRFGGFDETSRMHQSLRRQLKGRAMSVEVDASGRIGLPQEAREKAGIDKDVVVLGNTGRFEIWAPDRYEAEGEEFDLSMFYQS